MRGMLKMAAIVLVGLSGAVQAAEPPCLTAGEFTGVASYALPSVISGTAQRCATTLPTNSYLLTNSDQLVTRYAAGKPAAWPVAKAAFLRMSAATDPSANGMIAKMPDESLKTMFDAMVEGLVAQQIPLERCDEIDGIVRLVAPLPPENTAELIAIAAGLGAQSGKARTNWFSICPA